MKVKWLWFVLTLVTLSYSADEGKIPADGISIIEENNIAKARTAAIDDAQKKAINQFISTLVPSGVLLENFKKLDEKVFSRSVDFIKSFRVTSETIEGNILRVKVDVFLDTDALKRLISQLGLAMFRGDAPRILLMIAEQEMDGKFYWWWNKEAEGVKGITNTTISNLMKEHNFVTVEPDIVKEKIGNDSAFQIMEPNNDILRRIGKESGVDIVLYGQAKIEDGAYVEGSTLMTCSAELNIRALNVDSGKEIFDDNYKAGGVHTDQNLACKNALKKVSDISGEKVIPRLEEFWRNDVLKITDILIEIKGLHKLSDVEALLSMVQKIKNVRAAQMKSFSPGVSVIQAEVLDLTVDSLISELMQNQVIYQRFQIVSRDDERVVFAIRSQTQP